MASNYSQLNPKGKKEESSINLVDLFFYLLSRWPWFLLSVILFGGCAWLKYASTPMVYRSSTTVVIKDPSNTQSTVRMDRYSNLINNTNVSNEILQFQSKKLMKEVVTHLSTDVSYKVKDFLRVEELYTQSPIKVVFPDISPVQNVAVVITPKNKKQVLLTIGETVKSEMTVALGDTVQTVVGKMVIMPTLYYNAEWMGRSVHVNKQNINSVIRMFLARLSIRQEEDDASILSISLQDNSLERSKDMLNMLVNVYNEEAINDKNQVAVNTANFIKDRLNIIEQELGGVESELESFKRENQLIDIGTSASMYTSETQKYNSAAMELETQTRLAKYIRNYLVDSAREVDLIPSNIGLSDMNIEGQISQYNSMKLRRDKLLDDSSDKNPVVQELNNSLRAMRQTIIRAVDNMIVSLDVKLNDAQNLEKRAQTRIASVPTKERQMLSIERQQKIKESLYIFLLNKREENALTQAMADNNARVMDEADGSSAPIYPQRNKMLLLGVLVGIALPALFFIAGLFIDTRVRSRKDIEDAVSIPFLGEIPFLKQKKEVVVQVRNEGNNMLSEAFRIIRTNIGYMGVDGKQPQVITFTSFNIGAGKTFVAMNLAACVTYTGKRVVALDLDIRKRSLTMQLSPIHSQKGVTNYLSDNSLDVSDVLIKDVIPGLDLIPAGPVAPNPVELLMSVRLEALVTELRSRYDYVIIDNVPFGIVADASIINRVTDLTAFVVRVGKLDRRMLPEIDKIYEEKKLNNLALLLNGVDVKRGGYGYHYGYGYGYHYGYGDGYGSSSKKKRFWKR